MIKLPKPKVREFAGDPVEWPEWSSLVVAILDSGQSVFELSPRLVDGYTAFMEGVNFSKVWGTSAQLSIREGGNVSAPALSLIVYVLITC